jgi:hypothetical protein
MRNEIIDTRSTEKGTYCTAFSGSRRIASGQLRQVALAAKRAIEADPWAAVLIFDDSTGKRIELDLGGSDEDVLERLGWLERAAAAADTFSEERPNRPGRPKLGVVAREVTLLPRHWDWLNQQPGGASVALRKLIEEARRTSAGADRIRQSQEVSYRFISAMAGDLPGFEEATRALFAGDSGRFDAHTAAWPPDIREYARNLATAAFEKDKE